MGCRLNSLFLLVAFMAFWILDFPINAEASTEHICTHLDFNISIKTDKDNDVAISVSRNNIMVTTCTMEVTDYYDGLRGASVYELTRFKKIRCDVVDGKSAAEIILLDHGTISRLPKSKSSSADIIGNNQPLKCIIAEP